MDISPMEKDFIQTIDEMAEEIKVLQKQVQNLISRVNIVETKAEPLPVVVIEYNDKVKSLGSDLKSIGEILNGQ
jgi:uncharacterized protein (UPF0335 family)